MYVGGGGGLQGMGILADRSSPFQLAGFGAIENNPALSEIIRWMESVTGIDSGSTYSNGVFGGGDPTKFGMSPNPSLTEAQGVKMAIAGIQNRDPVALAANLTSSNTFLRNLAMSTLVSVFGNGMGGRGQGYAIYKQQPAPVQATIKAAWLAANGNGKAAQDAWIRIVEGLEWEARVNRALGSTPGRAIDADGNVWTDGVGRGQNLGNLHDPNFNAWADTVSFDAPPPEPTTERQDAPTFTPAGSSTPGPMPTSFPTPAPVVPPATPADVQKVIDESTDAGGNIPAPDTGGETAVNFTPPVQLPPVPTGDGGGYPVPPSGGGEIAVPASTPPQVINAAQGFDALTPEQKKVAMIGAGILAFILLRKKGK